MTDEAAAPPPPPPNHLTFTSPGSGRPPSYRCAAVNPVARTALTALGLVCSQPFWWGCLGPGTSGCHCARVLHSVVPVDMH